MTTERRKSPRVEPADFDGMFCGDCTEPCDYYLSDVGEGPYEFWGQTGVHVKILPTSTCCQADVFANPELTREFKEF